MRVASLLSKSKSLPLMALFCAGGVFASCGLPNPSFFANESNPPYALESYSSNDTIFLKVRSFNKSNVRKFIRGYNIHFGYIDEDEDILRRTLYLEPGNLKDSSSEKDSNSEKSDTDSAYQKPSILMSFPTDFDEREIPLTKLTYHTHKPSSTEATWVKDEQLRKFVSYFFIISPHHQEFSNARPKFFFVCKETIEENQFGQTLAIGDTFSFEEVSFTLRKHGSLLELIGVKETKIQSLGFATDFFAIREAPEKGYVSSSIPIHLHYVYAYEHQGFYGKIFIQSISSNQIIFDFSYQGKQGEREI